MRVAGPPYTLPALLVEAGLCHDVDAMLLARHVLLARCADAAHETEDRAVFRDPPRPVGSVGDVRHFVLQLAGRLRHEQLGRQPDQVQVTVCGYAVVVHGSSPCVGAAIGRRRRTWIHGSEIARQRQLCFASAPKRFAVTSSAVTSEPGSPSNTSISRSFDFRAPEEPHLTPSCPSPVKGKEEYDSRGYNIRIERCRISKAKASSLRVLREASGGQQRCASQRPERGSTSRQTNLPQNSKPR